MTEFKTLKIRLYPTEEQKVLLSKHFGCTRLVYNHFLEERTNQYKETGKSDNYYEQAKKLTQLKKQEEYGFLYEVSNNALQNALRNLEIAFKRFFNKITDYPRKKSKKSNHFSYTVNNINKTDIKIKNNRFYFPMFQEGMKFKGYKKDLDLFIKHTTIEKTASDKYYASLCISFEPQKLPVTGKMVGIDLGIKTLTVTSDNEKIDFKDFESFKNYKKYEKDLKKAQRALARKTIGSHRYENQRLKKTNLNEKLANCRTDMLHKLVNSLISRYDIICIEDLNTKGMMKNHKLARSIAEACWGKLVNLLEYKARWYGRQISKVSRFYPSSKTCHICGYKKEDLTLKDRDWACPNCNTFLDRDYNASINILKEGLRILTNIVEEQPLQKQRKVRLIACS